MGLPLSNGMSAPKMARRLAHRRTQASFARQAQVSVSAQNAGASAHSAGSTLIPCFHPNEEQTMKTGIRMAVAMVTAVSSGAMAAPFSVSSNDMRDGSRWPSSTGLPVSAVPEAMFSAAGMEKRPGGYAQLRGHRPGSRCAFRQRLVALDGGQYRQQFFPPAGADKTALHCRAERSPQRFWLCRLRRRLSAGGDKPHRYRFTVWALDVPRCRWMPGALVGYLLHSHALASAQLTAMAGR